MNWLIFLFGSGTAFFLGVGLVLVSIVVFAITRRAWTKVIASLVAVIGLTVVTFSATPLPYWLYAIAGGVTLPWLIAERYQRPWLQARRNGLRWAVAIAWVAAAAIEFPYHLTPAVAPVGRPTLYILGDSISAGTGERQETWPQSLARKHSIEVVDLSRVGADMASALRQAKGLPSGGGLVLLEIGGNDILGATPVAQFEQGLDQLLGQVCVPGRTTIMFELPLPPFCNDYGRAQRRIAAKYHVPLIPKRILIAVLTGNDATLDSLHLTSAGHERMADATWAVIRTAYGE